MLMLDLGSKVILTDDPVHVGIVERSLGDRTYVRWRPGYATLECTKDLQVADPESR